VELSFDDNGGPPEPTRAEKVLSLATRSQSLLRYGTTLSVLLLFTFFVARPVLRSLAAAPRTAPGSAAVPAHLQAGAEAAEMPAEQRMLEQRREHAQTVFEQVADNVKRDPAQSSRLLESWIRSE
jgi:flagellar M-ring protein FliF